MKAAAFLTASIMVAVYINPCSSQTPPARCLTDAEVEAAVVPQIKAGLFAVNTVKLQGLPLCSGMQLADKVQEISARHRPNSASQQAPIHRNYNTGPLPLSEMVPNRLTTEPSPRPSANAITSKPRTKSPVQNTTSRSATKGRENWETIPGPVGGIEIGTWVDGLDSLTAAPGTPSATSAEAMKLFERIADVEFRPTNFLGGLIKCGVINPVAFSDDKLWEAFRPMINTVVLAKIAKERAISRNDAERIVLIETKRHFYRSAAWSRAEVKLLKNEQEREIMQGLMQCDKRLDAADQFQRKMQRMLENKSR